MIIIEFEGVKEIYDKFESILAHLKSQFAKFTVERDRRETILKDEAESIENSDLPISAHVVNFLEWDSTALLLEEQRIETYDNYIKGLYDFLKGVKSQKERIIELTEELGTKEEDIMLMGDIMKKKDKEIKRLKEETDKLLSMLKKTKMKNEKSITPEIKDDVGNLNQRKELVKGLVEKPRKGKKRPIKCQQCGKTEYRVTTAKYCVECAYLRKKKYDRGYHSKKYEVEKEQSDEKGEIIEAEEGSEIVEEPRGIEDSENVDEPLDEQGEYANVTPYEEQKIRGEK